MFRSILESVVNRKCKANYKKTCGYKKEKFSCEIIMNAGFEAVGTGHQSMRKHFVQIHQYPKKQI